MCVPSTRLGVLFIAAFFLSGCDYFRDQLYGERGIQELTKRDQHRSFREVDLVLLLDPTNKRGAPRKISTTGNDTGELQTRPNEIDRALSYFRHKDNNELGNVASGFGNLVKACQVPKKPTPVNENGVPTKYGTVKITRTTVSTARQGFDKLNNPIGDRIQETKLSESYQYEIVSTGPKKVPTVCGEERVLQLRRNVIAERLIAASEQQCEQYKDLLTQVSSDVIFSAALATTGLGAAGALVDGASQILSAAAGAVGASAVAVNQSYFNSRTIGATLKAIDADRIAIRTLIREGLKKVPNAYPMERALGDVARFHYACSLRAGVETLDKTTEDRLDAVKAAAAKFGATSPAEGAGAETQTPGSTGGGDSADGVATELRGALEVPSADAAVSAVSPASGAGQ